MGGLFPRSSGGRFAGQGLGAWSPVSAHGAGSRESDGVPDADQPVACENSGSMDDDQLRSALARVDSRGWEILRRKLLGQQQERDELAERLLRDRSGQGDALADLLDLASLNQSVRQQLARVLGELEARG